MTIEKYFYFNDSRILFLDLFLGFYLKNGFKCVIILKDKSFK